MPGIEYPDIHCPLGRTVEKIPDVERLQYFRNLGIINKNTLILKIKFKESPKTEIYLPATIDSGGNFTTKVKIGEHTLEITVSKEDYKLTAKHWSEWI